MKKTRCQKAYAELTVTQYYTHNEICRDMQFDYGASIVAHFRPPARTHSAPTAALLPVSLVFAGSGCGAGAGNTIPSENMGP